MSLNGISHEQLELAGLIPAERETGQVIALDPYLRSTQSFREARHPLERRGEVGKRDAGDIMQVHLLLQAARGGLQSRDWRVLVTPDLSHQRQDSRHPNPVQLVECTVQGQVERTRGFQEPASKPLLELVDTVHTVGWVDHIRCAPHVVGRAADRLRPAHRLPLQQIGGHLLPVLVEGHPIQVVRRLRDSGR